MQHNTMKAFYPFAFAVALLFQAGAVLADHKPAASIPTTDLLQPAELTGVLKNASAPKPLMLHVGFRKLYTQAHIPASEYVGPTSEDAGLQLLRSRVAKLPKDTSIVIYCGCCPWSHCPNLAAAYDELHALGFTHVKALYIESNFGDDWVSHGYSIAGSG